MTMNERNSVGDISHDNPNTIDLHARCLNILFKTLVTELHIDKMVRVNDTHTENCDKVLIAFATQLPDCTLLVFNGLSSDCSEGFGQFSCKSLSVISDQRWT